MVKSPDIKLESSIRIFKRPIYLLVAFAFISMAYIKSFPYKDIKQVAVLITMLMAFSKSIQQKDYFIGWRDAAIFAVFFATFLIQDTTWSQKLTSIFFSITLITWTRHGEDIISNDRELLFIAIGIVIVIAVGVSISGSKFAQQLAQHWNTRHRKWGVFNHPNQLGGMSLTVIITMLMYLIINWERKIRFKLALYIIIAFAGYVLYFTKSRTSWIMLITFIMIFAMRKFTLMGKATKYFMIFLVILSVCAIAYWLYTEIIQTDAGYQQRLNIFDTMKITPKTFWVGTGMTGKSDLDKSYAGGSHLDIAWVTLFYKNGVIGVLIFIYILLNLWLRIKKVKNDKQRWLAYALFGSFMIGTLSEAIMVNIMNAASMMYWIVLRSLTCEPTGISNNSLPI